jgi:hypothetical protein
MTDEGAGTGLLDRLGPRTARRPSPRVGVTMAATGSALVVAAALIESGSRLAESGSGSPNRWPGLVLSSAVLAAGVAVLVRFRRGPMATAGVAATALATPILLFFLTVDFNRISGSSVDTILALSTATWAGSYLVGPARGHGFYLGAALIGAWLFAIEETGGIARVPFAVPFALFGSVSVEPSSSITPSTTFLPSVVTPSTTNIGTTSVLFAVAYLVATWLLDRRGRSGMATPFVVAGLLSLFSGIALLEGELKQAGTGLALIGAGLAVAVLGATAERRATTWVGGCALFFGVLLLAGKIAGSSVHVLSVLVAVLGLGVVAAAHRIHLSLGEPDETAPGPSTFTRTAPPEPTPF